VPEDLKVRRTRCPEIGACHKLRGLPLNERRASYSWGLEMCSAEDGRGGVGECKRCRDAYRISRAIQLYVAGNMHYGRVLDARLHKHHVSASIPRLALHPGSTAIIPAGHNPIL
jgi:hypothetical protein